MLLFFFMKETFKYLLVLNCRFDKICNFSRNRLELEMMIFPMFWHMCKLIFFKKRLLMNLIITQSCKGLYHTHHYYSKWMDFQYSSFSFFVRWMEKRRESTVEVRVCSLCVELRNNNTQGNVCVCVFPHVFTSLSIVLLLLSTRANTFVSVDSCDAAAQSLNNLTLHLYSN